MVQFGEPKDQDIAELEVTVNNADILVQVDESICDLWEERLNVLNKNHIYNQLYQIRCGTFLTAKNSLCRFSSVIMSNIP